MQLSPQELKYYESGHPDIDFYLPWQPDCITGATERSMDIVYPNAHERIYIPRDLNGAKQKIVAEATHKARDVQVHWYVDQAYYGYTEDFHSIELDLSVGDHVLYCIDDRGEEKEVSFEVLSR